MTATVAGIHLGPDTHANRPAAATPPVGSLYSCTTHSLVYRTDGASWSTFASAITAAGSVASDTIWDAAGDLAVGSGADTAVKLAKGADGGMLAMGNGSVIWNAGTSFPASKATNDRYWRTDLGMGFHYDGTNWVSDVLYFDSFNHVATDLPLSTTQTVFRTTVPMVGSMTLWAEKLYAAFFVTGGTALGASHKWVVTINNRPTNAVIATLNIDSGASDAWRNVSATMGSSIATSEFELDATATKTGTPGTLYFLPKLQYRIIAT